MASAAIHGQVRDSLQTLSVFVAFVTVLFGIRYGQLVSGIKGELPDKQAKPIAREKAQNDLRALLASKALPLVVLTAIPAYLFLPLTVRILTARCPRRNRWRRVTGRGACDATRKGGGRLRAPRRWH